MQSLQASLKKHSLAFTQQWLDHATECECRDVADDTEDDEEYDEGDDEGDYEGVEEGDHPHSSTYSPMSPQLNLVRMPSSLHRIAHLTETEVIDLTEESNGCIVLN